MNIARRQFIGQASLALAGAALVPGLQAASPAIRFGTCMMGLEDAKLAGFDGAEVSAGNPADRLEIADSAVRARYKEQMQKTGLPVSSLMMGVFNQCPLATDPRGPAWLEQGIEATHDLGAKVILVAFFGKGDLLDAQGKVKEAEVDSVVERLKVAAPRAQDAGVVLAIENYLDARQNARILERVNHPAVKLYYDCFNTGGTKGYDVPEELRFLKDRVAQLHFKNGPKYLENGQVKFESIAAAIKAIGYHGWIVLETSNPSKDRVADGRRNLEYARKLVI
ncbi:MAG: sugar phosphate isomerase/epimerase family protein [Verrucomicrobiota bacterium]